MESKNKQIYVSVAHIGWYMPILILVLSMLYKYVDEDDKNKNLWLLVTFSLWLMIILGSIAHSVLLHNNLDKMSPVWVVYLIYGSAVYYALTHEEN